MSTFAPRSPPARPGSRTSTRTVRPRFNSARTIAPPTRPVPPVTSTRGSVGPSAPHPGSGTGTFHQRLPEALDLRRRLFRRSGVVDHPVGSLDLILERDLRGETPPRVVLGQAVTDGQSPQPGLRVRVHDDNAV